MNFTERQALRYNQLTFFANGPGHISYDHEIPKKNKANLTI